MRFNIYRTNCRGIGGLVDFLGEINALSEVDAERKARDLYDFSGAEEVDVQMVCTTCDGMGYVTDEMERREVKCCHCDGSGEIYERELPAPPKEPSDER